MAFAIKRRAPRPGKVYDTYWRFAAERQSIFYQRLQGAKTPWTDDEVLKSYKFTNVYRASDRTSQFLIRNVIYRSDLPDSTEETVFRILLFKIFNKIETWQTLECEIGPLTYDGFSYDLYERVLSNVAKRGAIYNGAYIMPPGGRSFGHARKYKNHLALLSMMMDDGLPQALENAATMAKGFNLLRSYPTIGNFLAYQFVTDLNYSEVVNFSENEFVVPGPGSLSGLRKCFVDTADWTSADLIRATTESQDREFDRVGVSFQSLWGRPLQLIDCQNIFCELDKYARVVHPTIDGIGNRTRIKQKYTPNLDPIEYFFPPKWGLNDLIGSLRIGFSL